MTTDAIKALIAAQADMGKVTKNAQNPFLKNKYADLNAVLDVVLPALHAHGFVLVQPIQSSEDGGEAVVTRIIHSTGWELSGSCGISYKSGDMQSKGGAITYARRYGILALLSLGSEDDDGETAVGRGKSAKEPKQTQADELMKNAAALERFLKSAPSADELTEKGAKANKLLQSLRDARHGDRADQLDRMWTSAEDNVLRV